MKILFLVFLLYSFQSLANFECASYEFQGTLRLQEKAFFITFHEGTLSEIRIHVPKDEELKFLPYHDELMVGKYHNGTFTDLDFAVPDGKEFLKTSGDCK